MTGPLRQEIEKHLLLLQKDKVGVAVSGGSDSLALLYLTSELAKDHSLSVQAVTVDHGLRREAEAAARNVAAICADLGIAHEALRWRDWDGKGNTQTAARNARYALIAEWAQTVGIETVALGHTQDDQAETFVMRLARASGVDGLSAMPARRNHLGVLWLRPLLNIRRSALRAYLDNKGVEWIDDPSNVDPRFERIRVREQLAALAEVGIGVEVLAQVSQNLAQARDALAHQALDAAKKLVTEHSGALCIDWRGFLDLPIETQRRLLVASLKWLSGSFYPPRQSALETVWGGVKEKGTATLEGCILRRRGDSLWLCREFNAVCNAGAALGELWDGRWRVTGRVFTEGCNVAALGEEGLLQCAEWRAAGLPRDVLLSTPAVWKGPELVAAPLVKPDQAWQAVLERGLAGYFDTVNAH